jgi:hypothetical protein
MKLQELLDKLNIPKIDIEPSLLEFLNIDCVVAYQKLNFNLEKNINLTYKFFPRKNLGISIIIIQIKGKIINLLLVAICKMRSKTIRNCFLEQQNSINPFLNEYSNNSKYIVVNKKMYNKYLVQESLKHFI